MYLYSFSPHPHLRRLQKLYQEMNESIINNSNNNDYSSNADNSNIPLPLPPILLLHGEKDDTVPSSASIEMYNVLRGTGNLQTEMHILPSIDHHDIVLQLMIPVKHKDNVNKNRDVLSIILHELSNKRQEE